MKHAATMLVTTALFGFACTGCAAQGGFEVDAPEASVEVFSEPPELILVEGDVYVVQDSQYATYYVDGYYWEYRENTWYHTEYWDEPWVQVEIGVVPTIIVERDHAHYVHYHGGADAVAWREPRSHAHHDSGVGHDDDRGRESRQRQRAAPEERRPEPARTEERAPEPRRPEERRPAPERNEERKPVAPREEERRPPPERVEQRRPPPERVEQRRPPPERVEERRPPPERVEPPKKRVPPPAPAAPRGKKGRSERR